MSRSKLCFVVLKLHQKKYFYCLSDKYLNLHFPSRPWLSDIHPCRDIISKIFIGNHAWKANMNRYRRFLDRQRECCSCFVGLPKVVVCAALVLRPRTRSADSRGRADREIKITLGGDTIFEVQFKVVWSDLSLE